MRRSKHILKLLAHIHSKSKHKDMKSEGPQFVIEMRDDHLLKQIDDVRRELKDLRERLARLKKARGPSP